MASKNPADVIPDGKPISRFTSPIGSKHARKLLAFAAMGSDTPRANNEKHPHETPDKDIRTAPKRSGALMPGRIK